MAIRHLKIKVGGLGRGEKHAAYIAGVGKQSDRDDLVLLHEANLPKWATNAVAFFRTADANERANGCVYREIEFAIPREVGEGEGMKKFALDLANKWLGDRHAYLLAIHSKPASDGKPNTHCHLMFSERVAAGKHFSPKQYFQRNGAKKERLWSKRETLFAIRADFYSAIKAAVPEFDPHAKSANPEPKIGPTLRSAKPTYEAKRLNRALVVSGMRKTNLLTKRYEQKAEHEAMAKKQIQAAQQETTETDDEAILEAVEGSQGSGGGRGSQLSFTPPVIKLKSMVTRVPIPKSPGSSPAGNEPTQDKTIDARVDEIALRLNEFKPVVVSTPKPDANIASKLTSNERRPKPRTR